MRDEPQANSFVSQEVEASRLFFLEPELDENFSVVFGGFERCRPDYRMDRQNFPWFTFEFVSHGEGTLRLGDVNSPLLAGSCFIYGPSIPHRIVSSSIHPLRKYFVGFTGLGVVDFLEKYEINPGFVSRCLRGEPMRQAFDALIDRGIRKSRFASPLCVGITKQLLLMCRDDAVGDIDVTTLAFATYSRTKDFMEQNFIQVTSLDGVAKNCGLDAPYLCRLFAKFQGESPYQFLTRLRMEYASKVLLESDSSVKSVAAMLGFKDAFHFSRVFKSVHHVPPSRFRQTMHPQWSL